MRYKDRVFNIGSGELILIAVAALLILGPKRLPELARGIGKFMREFRRQTDEVRNVVEREFYRMDEPDQKPPKVLPAPMIHAAQTSPGGDDLHNPDGTLKQPPAVPPIATAPPAPGAPAAPAPAVKPATDPADHVAPIDDVKSQMSAALDHSDPAHPDYGKDEAVTPIAPDPKPTGS
ncbi:MAG: twin-arginine translocase TatA/TatE family subunit [Myxococcaceae bacterium]